jgi:phosphoglycolate phosphatase
VLTVRSVNLADLDAVIVDLDGTLVDTLGDFVVALNLMLADLPAPFAQRRVERPTVETLVGKGSEHLVNSVLTLWDSALGAVGSAAPTAAGADQAHPLFAQALAHYQRHYLRINGQHATVYPGVLEGLQQLQRRGLRLACLTNKPTRFALALLAAKGLDGFFEIISGGDAYAFKKPHPLPLLETCSALGTVPARTLMVGDSSNDAQAARAAGCPVLLVTYGYNHGQPIRAVDADAYTDSLARLGV